jgi:hypothetical protein
MNKTLLSFAAGAFLTIGLIACKDKKKEAGANAGTEQTTTSNDVTPSTAPVKPSGPANEPKTYQLGLMPDSIILGKEKEAFIKLLSGEAVELQDADGKSTGMNIKFKLRETNKSTLDKKKFFSVNSGDARLELDNGTNATAKSGDSLSADPEASVEATWEFETPAGTKPTKLNLFYDGTRVSVAVSMK